MDSVDCARCGNELRNPDALVERGDVKVVKVGGDGQKLYYDQVCFDIAVVEPNARYLFQKRDVIREIAEKWLLAEECPMCGVLFEDINEHLVIGMEGGVHTIIGYKCQETEEGDV